MLEQVTIQKQIERRTYLKGKFSGKFVGYLDPKLSDNTHEFFYNLEILSGEIFVEKSNCRTWKEGDEFKEFIGVEKFLTKLPNSLVCEISYPDGSTKCFHVNLNEPKLIDYKLSNQLYDGNKVLGDINGNISGYLMHYDTQIEVVPINNALEPPTSNSKFKTDRQTGNTETSGDYKRWEYYYSDNSTYWGDWQYQGKSVEGVSFWSVVVELIQLVFLALFILPIFVAGWKIILPLLILGGIIYLVSILQPILAFIWKVLIYMLSLAFVFLFIFGIFFHFTNTPQPVVKKQIPKIDSLEVRIVEPLPQVVGDSIISNHRIWEDYNKNTYEGDLEVRVSDFNRSSNFRNNLSLSDQNSTQYNHLVSQIYDFDKYGLTRIYAMFDTLKLNNNLNEVQFAQVITSCIQDIPYVLILENACNPRQYNDEFVRDYLYNGGACEGYTKFGFLSPVEFMATLKGDCDTRTLLLFTILNHFKYDVVMLSSELYKHSVIAINLPFNGVSKRINGKQYVVWETTELGVQPGTFPREFSEMRFWNVNLISNN